MSKPGKKHGVGEEESKRETTLETTDNSLIDTFHLNPHTCAMEWHTRFARSRGGTRQRTCYFVNAAKTVHMEIAVLYFTVIKMSIDLSFSSRNKQHCTYC